MKDCDAGRVDNLANEGPGAEPVDNGANEVPGAGRVDYGENGGGERESVDREATQRRIQLRPGHPMLFEQSWPGRAAAIHCWVGGATPLAGRGE